MDHRAEPQHHPAGILSEVLIIAGLGPGDLSRTPAGVREALLDPGRRVILRTGQHPAAAQLAGSRQVTTCDDLYDAGETFDEVYEAIVSRVLEAAETNPVVYATPGSPLYGERTVAELRARCRAAGRPVELRHATSFLDEVFSVLDVDPTERGFTVLDGRDLPDPLMLRLPTV
ncbi:MAG: SAM-dependent methyltransferase, partial [bacterium]|nr:SAM-dependent methyltransferase [bacterium]